MVNPGHLSDEQLARYRSRTLASAELLDVDEHLSACADCRGRASGDRIYVDQMRDLRVELARHLEYEEIVACAEGSPSPEGEDHLALCGLCRAEVADLREFRRELADRPRLGVIRRRRWIPASIAATVLIAVGASFWLSRDPKPVATAAHPLSPGQQRVLDLASSRHELERAPILDRLISQRGELLGPETKQIFALTGPMGTTVLEDQPTFRWTPVANAAGYVVSIFDENFNKVIESDSLKGTSWSPGAPLLRGQVYLWQAKARVRGKTVQTPLPPEPEARFEILPGSAASEIETARREHPENHLLLAALCAKAGDLEDASKEIDALSAKDPAAAAALRASLARIRAQ